jgi:hypothetical protein
MSKTKTPPAKQAILDVLKIEPQATVAQIAVSVGIGRSTAGKMLTQLEGEGEVRRAEGGRDGNRRLPDQWSLASRQAAPGNDDGKSATKKPAAAAGASATAADRLKPGQLEPLVLAYLKKNAKSGPHGPTAIAKALERSSGAVGNCLVRLTREEQVREVSEKPRRYTLAA